MKITSDSGTWTLPGVTGRKKIVVYNGSAAAVYWGWEKTTTKDGDTQGVPLPANSYLVLDASLHPLTEPLYFAWTAGQTAALNWTNQ